MKWLLATSFFPFIALLPAIAQAPSACYKFAVTWQDDLGNSIAGFPDAADAKFQKKLAKKYPHVCANPNGASAILSITTKPAVYRGIKRRSEVNDDPVTGTVTDSDGNVSTVSGTVETTSTSTTPYSVEYRRLYLTVWADRDGKLIVVHSFSGETIHPTMYGLCTHNCHPTQALIDKAVKWLAENAAKN